MALDTSIYANLLARPRSPDEVASGYLQQAGLAQNLLNSKLQFQEAQNAANEKNSLREYLGGGADLSTPEGATGLFKVAPTQASGILKAFSDQQKSGADAQKAGSEATAKAIDTHRSMLAGVDSPQAAADWVKVGYSNPLIAKALGGSADQMIARIPTDPAAFQQWKQANALGATKLIELNKPTIEKVNTGGATSVISVPGLGGTPTTLQTLQNTQSPDNVATNATSRANNAATIKKDLMVAGLNQDGMPSGDMETTAQAIAKGQLPPPSGMALTNPKNQRILARVMEINPNYDFTDVTAKKKAASDFTTGTLGNSMRSFAVAGQHLDQLGQLVDAMDNGNTQLVNKIGNAYSQQTGNPAVTNFDAAKDVVSKEVVKAIVAGGGGVAEREELSKLMDNAKSPAQLKGVIQQYRNLMAAQHGALLQQRRAAGLPDSTLPAYTDASGSPASVEVPPDIAAILKKHGGK